MIIIQRQDYVHKLCILCTCFMLITSIFNILFIIRRYSSSTSTSTSDDADNKNIEFIKPSIISTNDITESNRTKSKSDLFEKTYRKFLRSFMNSYSTLNQSNQISYCPEIPPDLLGPIIIEDPPANFSISNQSIYHPNVLLGGSHQPKTCLARHKIAIIVPYRDRQEILRHFLYHTHLFLQRQQLDYRIYLCEQAYDKVFNKGIVMNSCFKEILKLEPSTPCFIMHDVDLLLIDDRNMYTCPMNPRHLSVAIDKFHFYLPYKELVGGVLAMRREHYLLVNGYSTNYWGWGGEDDDMHARIVKKKLILERPPTSIARYKMLRHTHQKLNPSRLKVLRTANIRVDTDGINNVKYQLLNTTLYHLYTHFLIDVGEQKLF